MVTSQSSFWPPWGGQVGDEGQGGSQEARAEVTVHSAVCTRARAKEGERNSLNAPCLKQKERKRKKEGREGGRKGNKDIDSVWDPHLPPSPVPTVDFRLLLKHFDKRRRIS